MTEKKARRPRLYLRGRITHRLITKTAAELFLELGYFKTSLVLISERAFVSYGTVYAHFKNKDHILTTIADEIFVRFYETIEELFEPEDKEQARDSFYNLALTLIGIASDKQAILKIYKSEASQSAFVGAHYNGVMDKLYQYLASALAYSHQQGQS